MTTPTRLVAMLDTSRPVTYSGTLIGLANTFRKLRDHTSSKNDVVTPCITRDMKSQNSTAPSSAGTKRYCDCVTDSRNLVINPQSTMSIATHTNNGTNRAALPRYR